MQDHRAEPPPATAELRREFEFVRELGSGGSAVVYLARDRELDRPVAIKLIRGRARSDDEECLARFAREARAAARLDHPHIVAVHAVRRLRDGGLALVMRYVPGRTLKQTILADGPFAFARATRVLREIGDALAHAHERGIVHRDVKPENIFLHEESGAALLADFGIARVGEPGAGITVADVALGTPAYMAPEQIDGATADPRSDLYGLGCVGWEMLTGEAPWEGETLYSIIYKQKHEALPPITRYRPDVPYALRRTIERALAKNPAGRFDGAAAMLAALDGDGHRWTDRLRETLRGTSARLPRRRAARTPVAEPAADGSAGSSAADTATAAGAATIRYRRPAPDDVPGVDEARPAEAGGASTPAPVDEPRHLLLTRRGIRYAAATWGLIVLTGAGATLGALTRAAANGAGDASAAAAPRTGAYHPASDVAAAPGPAGRAVTATTAPAGYAAAGSEVTDGEAGAEGDVEPADPTAHGEPRPDEPGVAEPADGPVPPGGAEHAAELAAAGFSATAAIVAGGLHTCDLAGTGELRCWGGNSSGQVGDGSRNRVAGPRAVQGAGPFRQVAAGLAHSCGLAASGEAYCWGDNDSGQLGRGARAGGGTPAAVAGGLRFRTITAGSAHSCGLTPGGELFCWGNNGRGQLGDGTASRTAPRRVAGRFAAVAAGWNHTCALDRQGAVYCWGDDREGQLGSGEASGEGVRVAASEPFRDLAAGGAHTCALTGTGEAVCWGSNARGQLGDGGSAGGPAAVVVAADVRFTAITAGGVHTCALTAAGEAFCWGGNMYGQIGDGTRADRTRPARVAGALRFAQIHASGSHTCGVARDGERFCWGYNVEGQLGDGTRGHRDRPIRVAASDS